MRGLAGDLFAFRDGINPEPGIGDDFVVDNVISGGRVNVSAQLELHADGDGFGDETQDDCPTDASTQGPCDTYPPETTITKGAPNTTDKSKLKFRFTSDDPSASFECKLDKKA